MRAVILEALHQICGDTTLNRPIVLHEPDFRGTQARVCVRDCLDSGWVSTAGQWVSRFEHELCARTGATHAVAVTNGTAALRLALQLLGVKAGDEVLLPPLSFVATANAVAHLGATPHFVDVAERSLGMGPAALATHLEAVAERRDGELFNRSTGRCLAAVLPVHVFGHPAPMAELLAVAEAWGLPLVEDAAEALGSWRDGIHCGLFGAVGTLSFNGNKMITTGGGGALSLTVLNWPSAPAISQPLPNSPTPGRSSTMWRVGTIAFPTSTPLLGWPSWRTCHVASSLSASWLSAIARLLLAWRGWNLWPNPHAVAAITCS